EDEDDQVLEAGHAMAVDLEGPNGGPGKQKGVHGAFPVYQLEEIAGVRVQAIARLQKLLIHRRVSRKMRDYKRAATDRSGPRAIGPAGRFRPPARPGCPG